MRIFLEDNDGLTALEYLVVAAIITALVLTALWSISTSLRDKLINVNNNL